MLSPPPDRTTSATWGDKNRLKRVNRSTSFTFLCTFSSSVRFHASSSSAWRSTVLTRDRILNKDLTGVHLLKLGFRDFYFHNEGILVLFSVCKDVAICASIFHKIIKLIEFGSTAKHTYKDDSDIDIIEVYNRKTTNSKAAKYVETQTGMRLSMFQMTYNDFIKELKMKEDHVIQSGINTGFPVYNNKYFYEVLYNERI